MAVNHIKNWEVLLQAIAAMDGTSCGREGLAAVAKQQQQHCHTVYWLTEEFKQANSLDTSIWEELINEHKVPQRLAALCCSSSNSQLNFQQQAAVSSLSDFVVHASQHDWFFGCIVYKRPTTTLAKSLAEQLLQSGFLQQLPVLLSTAADQLEAVQDEQEMLASTQLSNKQRNALLPTMLPFVALLQQHAIQLLALVPHMGGLSSALPAAVVIAAQRLVCAAIQHSCSCFALLPDQTAPAELQRLPLAACGINTTLLYLNHQGRAVGDMSSAATKPPPPALQQLHLPEQLRACCTLLLLALCQQHARKLHRQLGGGSLESQERGSSMWEYACTQHSQLPQPYLQLCQALGYSSREFLYVACSSDSGSGKDHLGELMFCIAVAIEASAAQQKQQQVQGLSPQRASTPTQQEQQQQQQQKTKDLAALLSLASLSTVAVLRWAAGRPLKAAIVTHTAAASKLASQLLHWMCAVGKACSTQVGSQQTANMGHTQQQDCQQGTMQWWITGEVLEQALVLISTLIQKLRVGLSAEEAAAAAGGAAADAGSSSSSSSTKPLVREDYWAMLCNAAGVLQQLRDHSAALNLAELLASAGSSQPDTQQPTSCSEAWTKHMPLLLRASEASTRSLAHHRKVEDDFVRILSEPLEAFNGPAPLLASYWRPGASSDLDPQLISTCFSVLKALEVCPSTQKANLSAERSEVLYRVLHLCLDNLKTVRDSSAQDKACAGSSASETAAGLSSSSSSSKNAVSVLPWLVLLGRCCPFWAADLQFSLSAACVAQQLAQLGPLSSFLRVVRVKMITCVLQAQEASLVWLQHDSNSAELAAAGYDTRPVIAALQALTFPAGAAQHNADASDSRTAVGTDAGIAAFAQQLQPVGRALNTLAISCACNNPHCSNLEGPSEFELVQGRARLCGKCRVARYCSKACQAQHWKLHKPACKALEAARQAQSSA